MKTKILKGMSKVFFVLRCFSKFYKAKQHVAKLGFYTIIRV
jgi:hypothetical protein